MTRDVGKGILGVSLSGDQLRIVEGRMEADVFEISQVAHGRVRQAFTFEAFADKNTARRFAEDINRLYETQSFQEKQVAFSLDSGMVLIKKVPIDKELAGGKVSEQIKWEVGQFSISPLSDYVIDYEEIASESKNGSIKDMLVVVVRKKIVEYLRQVFSHTHLQLKVVDVDLFSAQRALQRNYDYSADDKIALIGIEEKKTHFSILSGRNYYLSEEITFPAADSQTEDKEEAIARVISKELKRIVMEQQIGAGVEDLSEIYLYGEAVEDQVLAALQQSTKVRIDRANPFKKVNVISQAKSEINETRPEPFVIAVGAALRGIE